MGASTIADPNENFAFPVSLGKNRGHRAGTENFFRFRYIMTVQGQKNPRKPQ
jgi:hypothetical protein